jgi:ribosomal protein S12 methylthiotransferase
MEAQKHLVADAQAGRIGRHVRILVDGPSDEHELVLRGRLESQAPEIDPVVYLTECNPGDIAPGTFIDAEIVGNQSYDLIARPLSVTTSV